MRLEFHPAVQKDFNGALEYYEREAGLNIANRFETEFRAALIAIKAGPTRFAFYQRSPLFRRIRLNTFPSLIVYRKKFDAIRVTLLKHECRHPLYGIQRW